MGGDGFLFLNIFLHLRASFFEKGIFAPPHRNIRPKQLWSNATVPLNSNLHIIKGHSPNKKYRFNCFKSNSIIHIGMPITDYMHNHTIVA